MKLSERVTLPVVTDDNYCGKTCPQLSGERCGLFGELILDGDPIRPRGCIEATALAAADDAVLEAAALLVREWNRGDGLADKATLYRAEQAVISASDARRKLRGSKSG